MAAKKKTARKKKATRKKSSLSPQVDEPTAPRKRASSPPADPVVIDDDQVDPEEEERRAAFDDEPVWNEVLLHPWTITRESIFYHLRAKMGSPSIECVNQDQENFLADAMRILWLCSHTAEEIRPLRAHPEAMQVTIEVWAETAIPRGTYIDATLLALKIFNGAFLNRPTSVEDGTPPGN